MKLLNRIIGRHAGNAFITRSNADNGADGRVCRSFGQMALQRVEPWLGDRPFHGTAFRSLIMARGLR